MFKSLSLLVLVVSFSCQAGIVVSEKLVSAIIQEESKGKDNAVGDQYKWIKDASGKKIKVLKPPEEWSYGAAQIGRLYIDEYNRIRGAHCYSRECLGNRELTLDVVRTVLGHYASEFRKKQGRDPSV